MEGDVEDAISIMRREGTIDEAMAQAKRECNLAEEALQV